MELKDTSTKLQRIMAIKLNLGSGGKETHKKGYINIDLYEDSDLRIDCMDIDKHWEENSVDEFYASHIIEHYSFKEVPILLEKIYKLLKPGGKLEIRIPDLQYLGAKFGNLGWWKRCSNGKSWMKNGIFGDQSHEGHFHKSGFSFQTIKQELEKVGFKTEVIRGKRIFRYNLIVYAQK